MGLKEQNGKRREFGVHFGGKHRLYLSSSIYLRTHLKWLYYPNCLRKRTEYVFNFLCRLALLVPRQENCCDCGIFVCRYAYNLYIMRNQTFSYSGVCEQFNGLITKGRAFNFGMHDIARIRGEIKALVVSLTELYAQFKKEEKAPAPDQRPLSNKQNDPKSLCTRWECSCRWQKNSPMQNSDMADDDPAQV